MDGAAPESGGGDPQAKAWDWNSPYWRKLGAPWGGTHASAPDVARFLDGFLGARGRVVKPETAGPVGQNPNPPGPSPRGWGVERGEGAGGGGPAGGASGPAGPAAPFGGADPGSERFGAVPPPPRRRAARPPRRDRGGGGAAAAARR